MKVATACTRCRNSKRKCFQSKAGMPCMQCLRSKFHCSLAPRPQKSSDIESPTSPTGLEDSVIEEVIEDYIRCIHDRPHSLFHLPTLRAVVREKKLKESLLYALLSFGCRFHRDPEVSSLGPHFFEESKRLLHGDLENICLENVQTCILLANLSAASLKASSEALYLAIAIRMAEILHFNCTHVGDSLIIREIKRKIWWTLYMFDRWCSAGNRISRKMDDFDRSVDMPMDECFFYSLKKDLDTYQGHPVPGIWAHMVTLAEIFGPIQDVNRRVVQNSVDKDSIDGQVALLRDRLNAWERDLAPTVRFSRENLMAFRERGFGGPFVALHLGFYHYATVLYYQYLDIGRVVSSDNCTYAVQCKRFALLQSSLLRTAREIGDCEMLYPGVGHVAVISSSVLLHTLLFGGQDEVEEALFSLKSNFEVLKVLRQYWPSLELTVKRLTVFQKACLRTAASQVYKFSEWVVKFLLEYHLELDDKDEVDQSAPTRTDWSGSSLLSERLAERALLGNNALNEFLV